MSMTPTLYGLVETQASRAPNAVATACVDQQVSYQELDERANQLAHHLCELGVGAEMLVGLSMRRGCDLVLTTLAVLKTGATCLPLDAEQPPARLRLMLASAGVRRVITERVLRDRF